MKVDNEKLKNIFQLSTLPAEAVQFLIFMSGHSKWATIKRQKGVQDQKRGQTFTKLSNAITLAVKQGDGATDPSQNFKLRLAIDSAKTANMPKDNIERAIKRAVGKEGGNMEEVIYEGFASGGVSVIVVAATDNSLRTTSAVKSLFNKAGASFGQPGSVSYQFKQMGKVSIDKGNHNIDDIFLLAVDSGAEDIEERGDNEIIVYTEPQMMTKVKKNLEKQGFRVISLEFIRKPIVKKAVSDLSQFEKIMSFLNKLEEVDDVQKVYSNIDFVT